MPWLVNMLQGLQKAKKQDHHQGLVQVAVEDLTGWYNGALLLPAAGVSCEGAAAAATCDDLMHNEPGRGLPVCI
jgi:hypothetical protein